VSENTRSGVTADVDKLVLWAFYGPHAEGQDHVIHLNHQQSNCSTGNLRWATAKEHDKHQKSKGMGKEGRQVIKDISTKFSGQFQNSFGQQEDGGGAAVEALTSAAPSGFIVTPIDCEAGERSQSS
jgi:hypothetical protein